MKVTTGMDVTNVTIGCPYEPFSHVEWVDREYETTLVVTFKGRPDLDAVTEGFREFARDTGMCGEPMPLDARVGKLEDRVELLVRSREAMRQRLRDLIDAGEL